MGKFSLSYMWIGVSSVMIAAGVLAIFVAGIRVMTGGCGG